MVAENPALTPPELTPGARLFAWCASEQTGESYLICLLKVAEFQRAGRVCHPDWERIAKDLLNEFRTNQPKTKTLDGS